MDHTEFGFKRSCPLQDGMPDAVRACKTIPANPLFELIEVGIRRQEALMPQDEEAERVASWRKGRFGLVVHPGDESVAKVRYLCWPKQAAALVLDTCQNPC